jgi:LuxR family maltose regulon positive regulatory protein
MDEPLLRTKLHIPITRPDPATKLRTSLIPRPRLIEQLNEGLSCRLTLISAPAGFGKTTLITSWLEQAHLPAAWISLDQDDNDFARFWTYLIAALQTLHPEMGTDVLGLLHSSPLPPSHSLLTLLLNDLTAISEKSILVLDDYHAIENETIDQSLTFFIEHLPSSLHLVISSRMDPNLPLARLRANGQLQELRSAELRFTPTETSDFLKQTVDQHLTAAQVAALDRRIEGWIAGLQMTALSLRQREAATISQFIHEFTGSDRYIMDYLVDEVLQQQPADVQTFLLYTSILDRLCGPLCEALWCGGAALGSRRDSVPPAVAPGTSEAQELLAYLEHANLFITPLDDQRHWFRYHPLFADLLRQRLQQTYPDRLNTLHLNASQWYEQAGLTGPAVQHALAAQAFDRAAALVEQAWPAMIEHGEIARLLTWLGALPDGEIRARPLLALY